MGPDRFLIVTADDFGQHEAVNEAVERAHRDGILTAASLMVGAPAAADAVRRARALPELRIGLHLVLVDGSPVLPPSALPALTQRDGRFRDNMVLDGARYALLPGARAQLAAEIRAQFAAFAATGLGLDHVNAHKHFHLHPTLLGLIVRIGREFGLRSVRLPYEPARSHAGTHLPGASPALRPWLRLMRRRLDAAGLAHNDQLFGIRDSGAMHEARLLELLGRLPPGVTEIYLHPATVSGASISPSMRSYRHTEELAALLSPRVRTLLERSVVPRGGFGDWLRLRALMRAA